MNKFIIDHTYTKKDIYDICDVPMQKQKGNWNTGYTKYDGDWFIFANIGVPGRTGHDYHNKFEGGKFVWFGKTHSHLGQESIKDLLNPKGDVYCFYRNMARDPFVYAGRMRAHSFEDQTPVKIVWSFIPENYTKPTQLPEEVMESEVYFEGATKQIAVLTYERNEKARSKCLEHFGYNCKVCEMNFSDVYGEIGDGFIHVHHLKQISEIGEEYRLDPIKDLRPVCPNCHAMLHRTNPPMSIEDLKSRLKKLNILFN